MSSSPSNMEELIDASPSPQHRCMKFTGRAAKSMAVGLSR